MKKLMVVTPYFYPKIGGLENYAYNISLGLKQKYNWDVVVITSNHKEKKYKEEAIKGMKIYRLPYMFKISNTPINLLWFFQIKKIIKKEKPDIINAHAPVPFIADVTSYVKGNTPYFLTYHSGSMIKGKRIFDTFINLYEKIVLPKTVNNANKIICSSDFVKKSMFKKYFNKTVTITPGVDTTIYKPNFKIKPNNKVLYIGKIDKSSEWKGIKYLLDAIVLVKKSVPNVILTLVGDGNQVNYYKVYSKKLGIEKNVKFVGEKTGQSKIREIQSSNVLVLPSTTNAESFGIVLIEAMACGIPVIGSKIGGIPYLINNSLNGFLVPPKNKILLHTNILNVLKNKKISKNIGETAYRQILNNFTLHLKIKNTNKIYYNSL